MPDVFGYVLWNGSAVVPSGTIPAASTVTTVGTGRYQVVLPGKAGKGVAHVTAINSIPHWCQLNSFSPSGADEVLLVSCYKVGGAPDVSAFSLIYDSSTGPVSTPGGQFGYVNVQASGAVITQYNSAGATNTASHSTTGQWIVKFPNLSTPGPQDGSLQATAVSQQVPARCKIATWSSSSSGQVAQVNCFNASGAPLDTQFTLTYQYQRSLYGGLTPPTLFGYLWNVPPVGPASTNYNGVLGAGMNTDSPGPLAIVTFPKLNSTPDDLQVTAQGAGSEFCGLDSIWTHSGADTIAKNVNCFNTGGGAVSTGFLISDNTIK